MVAHDLRTPITSIKGYLEMIQTSIVKENTEEYQSFINVIARSVNRFENLTENLLTSRKINSGALKLELSRVGGSSLIDGVKAEITPILDNKNQQLVVSSCENIECEVDVMKITQVLINLISNASKYSSYDSLVELNMVEEEGFVVFCVKDHGIGLRKEDISKLFEPFPDISLDGIYGRTGLGLSIVKSIVELHNGRVIAESDGLGWCVYSPV